MRCSLPAFFARPLYIFTNVKRLDLSFRAVHLIASICFCHYLMLVPVISICMVTLANKLEPNYSSSVSRVHHNGWVKYAKTLYRCPCSLTPMRAFRVLRRNVSEPNYDRVHGENLFRAFSPHNVFHITSATPLI